MTKIRNPRAKALSIYQFRSTLHRYISHSIDEKVAAGIYIQMERTIYAEHPIYKTYFAGLNGEVFHLTRKGKVIKLKPAYINSEYLAINPYINGKACLQLLHRFVYECWCGLSYKDMNQVIHHKDHDRNNNLLSNLEAMDKQEHYSLHGKENLGKKYRPRKVNFNK